LSGAAFDHNDGGWTCRCMQTPVRNRRFTPTGARCRGIGLVDESLRNQETR
jgi:hypothetical protein